MYSISSKFYTFGWYLCLVNNIHINAAQSGLWTGSISNAFELKKLNPKPTELESVRAKLSVLPVSPCDSEAH